MRANGWSRADCAVLMYPVREASHEAEPRRPISEAVIMAVPKFDALMLPLLQVAADGQEHRLASLTAVIADRLNLTEADRNEKWAPVSLVFPIASIGRSST
jgi:hypothetical protein